MATMDINKMAEAAKEMAGAIGSVANELKYLGNGDAATTRGAIEGLGMLMREGLGEVAGAIASISASVQDGLYVLSNSIDSHADALREVAVALGAFRGKGKE